jgi:hypothetical protein
MDKKSTSTTTTPIATQTAAVDAMSAPMPQQPAQTQPIPAPMAQTPMPATPTTMMASGGVSGSGSLDSFFRGVNWVDVGILMLGTAALYYTIYYYRIKIKAQKRELADIGNKMDMMEAKVSAIQKQQQAQAENTPKKKATF